MAHGLGLGRGRTSHATAGLAQAEQLVAGEVPGAICIVQFEQQAQLVIAAAGGQHLAKCSAALGGGAGAQPTCPAPLSVDKLGENATSEVMISGSWIWLPRQKWAVRWRSLVCEHGGEGLALNPSDLLKLWIGAPTP